MVTRIFKNYEEFQAREDKQMNGVSSEFAEEHPNYVDDNKLNAGCWNCKDCIECNYCYNCYYCNHCYHCDHCHYCYYCDYCNYCNHCDNCYNCDHCDQCDHCYYCDNCNNCNDCNDCNDCNHCDNCNHSNHCDHCDNCNDCNDCNDCKGCKDCYGCVSCNYCVACKGCTDLTGVNKEAERTEAAINMMVGYIAARNRDLPEIIPLSCELSITEWREVKKTVEIPNWITAKIDAFFQRSKKEEKTYVKYMQELEADNECF